MAELPDVEIFKIYLQTTALNQKIAAIKKRDNPLLKGISFSDFQKELRGDSFEKVERRGSFLIISLKESSQKLVFAFGTTGDLHYTRSEEDFKKQDQYTKLIFSFDNGFELRVTSIREQGAIYLVKDLKEVAAFDSLGESPLDIEKDSFLELLTIKKEEVLKAFLMNDENLAGIGDVYSDEIAFQAGLDPQRHVRSLSTKERKTLFKTMRKVLTEAIEYTKKDSFPEFWLKEHLQDMVCPNNEKHHLNKELVQGHRAVFCPDCQK